MPRGPAPKPDGEKRRRNAPTIPTTNLPAEGRKGRAPACPYKLGKAGRAWWNWAWKTPQAAGWDAGVLYVVARRAQLEDDLAAVSDVRGVLDLLDVAGLVGEDEAQAARDTIDLTIRSLKGQASGKLQIAKEMREIENRLGLNAKAMIDLRWKIVADEVGEKRQERESSSSARPRLRAVDPAAAAT